MKNFTLSIFAFLFFFSISYSQTYTSSDTYTVPSGVTQIYVQAWGAGGGGSDKSGSGGDGGNGGGGGGFRAGILSVSPGDTVTITVGTGGNGATDGNGNDGFAGGNTIVTHTSGTITANGGAGGVIGNIGGGAPAAAGTGSFTGSVTNQVAFSGGNGGVGGNGSNRGGGGGGGAGSNANGNNGTGLAGGTGGSGNGGNGGTSGNRNSGGNGSNYGGGGGASGDGTGVGGRGANGLVIISLVEPEINIISNGASIADGNIYPDVSNNTDFGSVNIGNTSTKIYTINNTGPVDLNISNINLSNTTDFEIVGTPYSSTVSAGGSTTFSVMYTGSAGKHSSTVTIQSDDTDEGTYTFIIRGSSKVTTDTNLWQVTNITANSTLSDPFEITYSPDDFLWISEKAGRIVRVSPADGTNTKTTILNLTSTGANRVYYTDSQDGLMGFAVHPDLYNDINTSNNFVYIAYTYNSGGRKLRIARFNYIAGTGLIDSSTEITLIEGIDASNDHNSARMVIGPDLKIYYTIGDLGANQFGNTCKPVRSQDLPTSTSDYGTYQGKVLRLNLDGTIPSDNPTLSGVQSHVYTYGHRNTQGIIFGANGKLYASEHGAKVDDELNVIKAGRNYGWPHIAGYYDNLAYGYCNWSSLGGSCNAGAFSDHNCPVGVTSVQEFDPVNSSILLNFEPPIGTYDSTTNYDPSGGYLTWPTVAPSSIDIYEAGLIPNWGSSLLITTLKEGTIYRAKLDASGDALVDITTDNKYEEFHSSIDRYRDLAMDPDGITFYAITDSKGDTSGPSGGSDLPLANPGVVMKFKYIGTQATPTTTYYVDADGDTFGDIADAGAPFASNPGAGYSLTNDDCDDTNPSITNTKPADVVTNETICSGETFTWNGVDYTTAQSGTRVSNDGCTADLVLNLTITPKPADIVTNATICSGETYTWTANGLDYTTAQSGTRILNNGCTADLVLNLTITPKPADIVTNATICSGETYTWTANSVDYTTAQSGTRISNNGCTADLVLNLTITPKPADIVTNATICSGETYTWTANSVDYTTAQSGLRISNNGCTADLVLNLTITPKPADIVTNATICSGETYTWTANSVDYTTAQSGLRISNNGCTADLVLNLTITPKPADIVTNATICSGETYTWTANSVDYTTVQSGTRISNNGCTADLVLNLTITPKPADIVTNATICSGETYTWTANSVDYTTAQSGLRISNNGCTADLVLNLTITPKPADIVTNATICSGETYTWTANGLDYTTAQSGLRISNNGCTADLVLNLTITPKPADIVTNATICSGETYTWTANGLDYTTAQSGTRISNNGCTADLVLNLTITPKPADIVTNATICSGETYTWTGNSLDYTTVQSGLRISNNGCTADLVLNLTVTPANQYYVDADGDGYGSTTMAMLCDSVAPTGFSSNNTDCDDSNPNINLGETEIIGNGIDDDCNPATSDGSLGIDDFNLFNVSMTPNPFNHHIVIKVPSGFNNSEFSIKIFDLNGRLVFDKKYSSNDSTIHINGLNNLQQAPYLLKLISKETGESIVKRLIKY